MAVRNSYPELPELKYNPTSVIMDDVIDYLKSLNESREVKAAAYAMFRNESGNGKSGGNHNYIGAQADVGKWDDYLSKYIVGTHLKVDSRGNLRRFLAFKDVRGSIDFLIDRVKKRGLYIGGTTHKIVKMTIKTPGDWALAYWREWVEGEPDAVLPPAEKRGLVSMLKKGEETF